MVLHLTAADPNPPPPIRLASRVRTPLGAGTVRWIVGLYDGQRRYNVHLDGQDCRIFRPADVEPLTEAAAPARLA